jgi:hypothetical protein
MLLTQTLMHTRSAVTLLRRSTQVIFQPGLYDGGHRIDDRLGAGRRLSIPWGDRMLNGLGSRATGVAKLKRYRSLAQSFNEALATYLLVVLHHQQLPASLRVT